MSNEVEFLPATAEDAYAFYGRPPPYSFRGFIAKHEGEVIGVGGIYYVGALPVAFTDMKPVMRQFKKARAKACRLLTGYFDTLHIPVYAIANSEEPTAEKLLAKLGFVPSNSDGLLVRRT